TNDCFALIGSAFAVQEEEDGSFSLTIPFERGSSAQETIDAMSPELLEASWACEERYWRDLGFLWNAIQRNPYNLDFDEMIVQCLIRSSLAVETLTVSDLRRLADLSFREDGIMQRLPGGPPLDDPAVWPCIHDPHHN
ncbi:MAG: hypothetical protein FWG11_08460, partial [Promicromonosporaceae bacterium]|nr:hypothetical protein [Promicromonosporaceae bacterium]